MNGGKFLNGQCQHCGGHLEFPAEAAGTSAACPHCGQATELFLVIPKQESAVPVRTIILTAITVIILVGGVVGVMVALNRAQRLAAKIKIAPAPVSSQPVAAISPDPLTQAGFRVSTVTLEKTPGSSLVYAVGTVRNETDRRRFGVRVELELRDAAEKAVGSAKDYQSTLEPGAEWNFKALVVASPAVSAKVVTITEDR